jgi:hypothetical protein
LQNISSAGLTTVAPPSLTVFQYDNRVPTSFQWNLGLQMVLPFTSAIDISYTGQHAYNGQLAANLNAIDFATAYLPQYQDPTQTPNGVNSSLVNTNVNQVRFYTGYSAINQTQPTGTRTYHSILFSWNRRLKDGISLGFNDTISLSDKQSTPIRLQHNPDGTITVRSDQAQADALLGNNNPQTHVMRASFIWQLPRINSTESVAKTVGYIANDWSLAGIWNGATGAPYSVGYSYTSAGANVNLTGSPDYGARVIILGDTGAGCSSNIYKQFNTAAFQGPQANSVGLESGNGYLKGCFVSSLDMSISRAIRMGGSRTLSIRFDLFNMFNQAAITGRNAIAQFASPATSTVITNLPYDANGNLIPSLSQPKNAGFGVANAYQSPRTTQVQIRFAF